MNKRKLNFANGAYSNLRNFNPKDSKSGLRLNVNLGDPLKPKPLLTKGDDGKMASLSSLNQDEFGLSRGNNNKVKMKQAELTRQASSTPTTTSSDFSTSFGARSTSTTPDITMARNSSNRRYNSNNNNYSIDSYNDKLKPDKLGLNLPPVAGSNDFSLPDKSSIIGNVYGDGEAKKVEFPLNLLCTTLLNDFETSSIDSGVELRPKMFLKCSSFGLQLGSIITNSTKNVDYYNALYAIYHKFDSDVGNTLNSYTSPNWTFAAFVDALSNIVVALENYYTLDSILAYESNSMGSYNTARYYESYKNLFQTQSILSARNQLKTYLKGLWLPPNMSQLIRWFYQSYKINPLEQSAMFRFVPSVDYLVSDSYDDTLLNTFSLTNIINNIKPTTNAAKISTIMNKVYPQGRITSLPKSCSDIVYDRTMLEVFVNDTYGYSDTLNTNTQSWYPVSYSGTINDIPYFMDINPGGNNGLAYSLQSIGTYSSTSVSTGNAPDFFWGLRTPGYTFFKDINGDTNKTNMQIVVNSTSGKLRGYAKNVNVSKSFIQGPNAHNAWFYFDYNTTVAKAVATSLCPPNFQRVYFDNYNGPRLILGELINYLFQTRA